MGKLAWQECDWTSTHDDKRPTENKALMNLKLKARLYLRIRNSNGLSKFYRHVARQEKVLMSRNYDSKSSVRKISEDLGISEQRVTQILDFCTIWEYYREIYEND